MWLLQRVRLAAVAVLALLALLALLVLLVPMALQRPRVAPPSMIAPLLAALPHRISNYARLMMHAHKGPTAT